MTLPPVDSFKDAAPLLRRPFTVPAAKFRILEGKDTGNKARARCAAYIDARLVIERLNLVCPDLWQHRFEPVQGGMRCDLTVDGLTRSDVGWSSGTGTDMSLKALYSDAFKRAAVHFGVGVSLYAIPGLMLHARQGHVRVWGREGKPPSYYIEDRGELELRSRYRTWLEQQGIEAYGEPLDHGDADEAPVPVELPLESASPPIGETGARVLLEEARTIGIHQQRLQLAASHVAGRSIEPDVEGLSSLSNDEAVCLSGWLKEKGEATNA